MPHAGRAEVEWRLKVLTLYIAQECPNLDLRASTAGLGKILLEADLRYFELTGESITRDEYQSSPTGIRPRSLLGTLRHLARALRRRRRPKVDLWGLTRGELEAVEAALSHYRRDPEWDPKSLLTRVPRPWWGAAPQKRRETPRPRSGAFDRLRKRATGGFGDIHFW